MKIGHCKGKVIRREKRSDDENKLVIVVENGKTSAKGSLSSAELIAFLGGGIPTLIGDLIKNIDDDDGGKYMKFMILTIIKDRVDDLFSELEDDSDDDD